MHILSLIRCQLNHGWVTIYPIKIITLIHSNILHQHLFDPVCSKLFPQKPNQKYCLGKHIIHSKANYFVCSNCASVSHKSCTSTTTNQCCARSNWQRPPSFLPVSISGKHRNFYYVLVHLQLHVKKPPSINYYTNSRRYPPILFHNRRHPNLHNLPPQILQPQQPQQPPPGLHVIPDSPQSSSTTKSGTPLHIRHV